MADCKTDSLKNYKVVIIAPTPAPYRAFEYDLVQENLRDEFEFHVLFLERHWTDFQWKDDAPKKTPWEVLPESKLKPFLHKIPGFRRVNTGIWRRLNELQPDALILHGYDSVALWSALFWARLHRRPLLCRSDSNVLKDEGRSRLSWRNIIKKIPLVFFFSKIEAFLSIGSANEDYYTLYGGKKERFFRSSYMVDVEFFTTTAAPQQRDEKSLKNTLGISEEKIILFVGRLIWEKDLENLLEAFALALPDLGDCAMVWVGDGPKRSVVDGINSSVREHLYLLGFCEPEQIGQIYGIANLLVLPSIQEAWGLVINEAMAAALPVISSDKVGAAVDLVVPGETGEIFPGGNTKALADCFRKILTDKSLCERMGKAGREHLKWWNNKFDVVKGYKQALYCALNKSGEGENG